MGDPKKPKFPHKRTFVWEEVPRRLFYDRLGIGESGVIEGLNALGWERASNRNRMLIYRDDCGAVHWYKGGLVRLYLRGPVMLARAKELFCRAFSFMTPEQWCKYLDVPLREESRHWVFLVGAPLPRFDIRQFERSHGIRIFTDGSHPTALEVEDSTPFWLDKLERVQKQFAENLKTHLAVQDATKQLVQSKILSENTEQSSTDLSVILGDKKAEKI